MAKKAKAPRITKLLTPHQLMVLMAEASSLSTPRELALVETLFHDLDPDTWEHHHRYGRYAMASVESKGTSDLRRFIEEQVAAKIARIAGSAK